MSELLRARFEEFEEMLKETSGVGEKLILEGFLELIRESGYGKKEAKTHKNFTILDYMLGCRAFNGTAKYQELISHLARIITEKGGFCSFGNYKIDMGGGYMRTGDFYFNPNRSGIKVDVTIC
ncbi:MAG TPA: hypothetical protein VF817_01270 [Patescibacteria group bacterium]